VEKTDTRKGDLQRAFPLNILMVHSSALAISAEGEHLTCSGFSLDETVCLGSFEFIADYYGTLSLSPRRNDPSASFIVSIRNAPLSLCLAMIEDSNEEFHAASSGEAGSNLPSHRRHDTRAPPTPIMIQPRLVDNPATLDVATIPPWLLASRPDTSHPFE
jgi:hypothetical protein